jgi:hypothetical protein
VDESLALERLRSIIRLIDEYGAVYEARWAGAGFRETRGDLHSRLMDLDDQVRRQARLAFDIAIAAGERELAKRIDEREEEAYGGHPWQRARKAILELDAILDQREELAAIVGPVGPQLDAHALHPTIWSAAAALWDSGHRRQAVQTAGQALEGLLQVYAGPGVSGAQLAALFSTSPATAASPRLRLRSVVEDTATWSSVHEGAAGLVRGAMMAVRNLVSHPSWPEPSDDEALEMLAVMSYVAHLVDRCVLVTT